MKSSQNKKLDYSQCVILVFNQESAEKLNEADKKILEGMKDKWTNSSGDQAGERLHIIYVGEEDFDDNKYANLSNNPKFEALKNLNPYSHVYILGHHYIEDNAMQISNDQIGEDRINFPISEVEKIFLDCIQHPEVKVNRKEDITFQDSSKIQKLKISLVLCDSAVGYVEEKDIDDVDDVDDYDQEEFDYYQNVELSREHLNSFASNFLNDLYNRNEQNYLDCVVTGIIGYVVPKVESTDANQPPALHKYYYGRRFTEDGQIDVDLVRHSPVIHKDPVRGSDAWKFTFIASPETTIEELRNRQVDIARGSTTTWEKTLPNRIDYKNKKIQHDLMLFKEQANTNKLANTQDTEKEIKKGVIDYHQAISNYQKKS